MNPLTRVMSVTGDAWSVVATIFPLESTRATQPMSWDGVSATVPPIAISESAIDVTTEIRPGAVTVRETHTESLSVTRSSSVRASSLTLPTTTRTGSSARSVRSSI